MRRSEYVIGYVVMIETKEEQINFAKGASKQVLIFMCINLN